MESEHRRGERNRRQTGSMYTPAYRVLVSSEFTEGSFIPRQTGIACAGEQQTRVTSAYLATLQTRPNPSTVGLPAPPPTAPCACAPPAAPPPARMPCRRPPARHFPHRCPTQPQCPACVRSLPMRPTPRLCLHRAPPRRRRHAACAPPAAPKSCSRRRCQSTPPPPRPGIVRREVQIRAVTVTAGDGN